MILNGFQPLDFSVLAIAISVNAMVSWPAFADFSGNIIKLGLRYRKVNGRIVCAFRRQSTEPNFSAQRRTV